MIFRRQSLHMYVFDQENTVFGGSVAEELYCRGSIAENTDGKDFLETLREHLISHVLLEFL